MVYTGLYRLKSWSRAQHQVVPAMEPLDDDLLLKVCPKTIGPVTTIAELVPSGATRSSCSNLLGFAEFTIGRRDLKYVGRTKEVERCGEVLRGQRGRR